MRLTLKWFMNSNRHWEKPVGMNVSIERSKQIGTPSAHPLNQGVRVFDDTIALGFSQIQSPELPRHYPRRGLS